MLISYFVFVMYSLGRLQNLKAQIRLQVVFEVTQYYCMHHEKQISITALQSSVLPFYPDLLSLHYLHGTETKKDIAEARSIKYQRAFSKNEEART